MFRSVKSLVILILIIIIGFIIFLLLDNFPKKVDISYPAVEFELGDPESVEETTVTIKGILKRPLFRSHVFEGDVIIDRYQASNIPPDNFILTKEFEVSKSNKNGKDIYTFVTSRIFTKEVRGQVAFESEEFGKIVWTDKAFENFSFNVFLEDYDSAILSAPTTTYDEAIQIYENLTNDMDWRHFVE